MMPPRSRRPESASESASDSAAESSKEATNGDKRAGRQAETHAEARTGRRFIDKRTGDTIVKVFQGDFYVTQAPSELLSCMLGSCVAACLRDPVAGLGGMNHFLLPYRDDEVAAEAALSDAEFARARSHYGNHAMDDLIGRIVALGGRRERLEAKIFGGARVLGKEGRIGEMNADFVEDYLAQADIPILAQSLRGDQPTMVRYNPANGAAWVRRVQAEKTRAIAKTEVRRRVRVHKDRASGNLEVFD